jgi:hypothetical protein
MKNKPRWLRMKKVRANILVEFMGFLNGEIKIPKRYSWSFKI